MNDNVVSHIEINRSLPIVDLKTMDDEAIKALIADGYKLLNQRKREREKAIKEQIKELAASEGIKVSFREPQSKIKRATKEI